MPWIGVAGAPVLWLTLLEANYVLSYASCAQQSNALLWIASGLTLVLMLTIAYGVLFVWRTDPPEIRNGPLRLSQLHDAKNQDPSLTSRHFMSIVGLFTSILFVLVVIATALPTIVLHPCD